MSTNLATEVAMGLLNLKNHGGGANPMNCGEGALNQVTPPVDKVRTTNETDVDQNETEIDQFDRLANNINSPTKINENVMEEEFTSSPFGAMKKCVNCDKEIGGFGVVFDKDLRCTMSQDVFRNLSIAAKLAAHSDETGVEICQPCLLNIGYDLPANQSGSPSINDVSRDLFGPPVSDKTTTTAGDQEGGHTDDTDSKNLIQDNCNDGKNENRNNVASTSVVGGVKRALPLESQDVGAKKSRNNDNITKETDKGEEQVVKEVRYYKFR